MWVPSLNKEESPGGGHGNPLHSLAWRIPWTEEPGGLWSIGKELDTTEVTKHTSMERKPGKEILKRKEEVIHGHRATLTYNAGIFSERKIRAPVTKP